MKVINIRIPYDLESIDIENDEIDVFVDTEEDYTYTLRVATPKYIQFQMANEKQNFFGPGYPLIFVNKLTPEIIEEAVKAFAEEEDDEDDEYNGYWVKIYHFGGLSGVIDESIFDQIRAELIEKRREVQKFLDEQDEFFDEPNE